MHEDRISAYTGGADTIARAVEGLPASVMAAAPSDDAWSIREILVHLSDAEIVYADRLRRAIGDDRATVTSFDESAWGDRLLYSDRDPTTALSLVRALRAANADLLRRLDGAAWERTVVHSEAGPITVAGILQALIDHDAYHLAQIRHIRAAHGIPEGAPLPGRAG